MKNKIIFGCISILALTIFLESCKKDEIEKYFNPTKTALEIPSYVTNYLGAMPIPVDNPLTEQGIALGRKLFYDNKLSNDLTMNCASCHKQENAFDDPRQFSQGTNGAFGGRNAMAIINLGWGSQFFWDGRRNSLENQALDPVTNPIEMANDWQTVVSRLQADAYYPDLFFFAFGTSNIDSALVTKAIAQFERSLTSFNSPFEKFFYENKTNLLNTQQKRGYDLFFDKAECIHCHSGPLLTDNTFKNNGLDNIFFDKGLGAVTNKIEDEGKFKVPTLKNIEVTAPYMHDGRFSTLEQVVEFYNSQVDSLSPNIDPDVKHFASGLNLTTQEKADLVAFLKTLTDQTFLKNPKFSKPK